MLKLEIYNLYKGNRWNSYFKLMSSLPITSCVVYLT